MDLGAGLPRCVSRWIRLRNCLWIAADRLTVVNIALWGFLVACVPYAVNGRRPFTEQCSWHNCNVDLTKLRVLLPPQWSASSIANKCVSISLQGDLFGALFTTSSSALQFSLRARGHPYQFPECLSDLWYTKILYCLLVIIIIIIIITEFI